MFHFMLPRIITLQRNSCIYRLGSAAYRVAGEFARPYLAESAFQTLMSKPGQEFRGIPIVQSGTKYTTEVGFSAIKNGVKQQRGTEPAPRGNKPSWLRAEMPSGEGFLSTRDIVHEHRLAVSTVCEESMYPNIGECWNAGTATIMVMGSVCTRNLLDTGNPKGWLDPEEPLNTFKAVQLMGQKYVVITTVDRDDLDRRWRGALRRVRQGNQKPEQHSREEKTQSQGDLPTSWLRRPHGTCSARLVSMP